MLLRRFHVRIHHRVLPGPGECSRTVRWHEIPEKYGNWGWRDREPYLHARKNLVSHNDIINNVVADLRPNNRHRGYIVFPYGSVKGSRIERNILLSCRRDQNVYWQSVRPSRGRQPGLLRETDADHNLYHCTVDAHRAKAHLGKERGGS